MANEKKPTEVDVTRADPLAPAPSFVGGQGLGRTPHEQSGESLSGIIRRKLRMRGLGAIAAVATMFSDPNLSGVSSERQTPISLDLDKENLYAGSPRDYGDVFGDIAHPALSPLELGLQPTAEHLDSLRGTAEYVEAQQILGGEEPARDTPTVIIYPHDVLVDLKTPEERLMEEVTELRRQANLLDDPHSHGSVRQADEWMTLQDRIGAYELALSDLEAMREVGLNPQPYDIRLQSGLPETTDGSTTYSYDPDETAKDLF